MTDGIIQQVINNYATTKIPHISFRDAKILADIEQELIEKIKQEIGTDTNLSRLHLKQLIGDTQQ